MTSLPISAGIPESADAAVDSRPVCPEPQAPPTFAKFGRYAYLGGLFVGQVPWFYGNRYDWQTSPDLSGTGRTLLKFYNYTVSPDNSRNSTNFPTSVFAACLSLAYTGTPQGVAASSPSPKQIGVVAVPRSDWDENSVSWQFLQENNLAGAFTNTQWVGWIGWTVNLNELLAPLPPENALDDQGQIVIRSERDWERSWQQIKRVVIPLNRWPVQDNSPFLSLLLALYPEVEFGRDLSSYVWYYFFGKDYPATNGRTCPRLWYVWQQ